MVSANASGLTSRESNESTRANSFLTSARNRLSSTQQTAQLAPFHLLLSSRRQLLSHRVTSQAISVRGEQISAQHCRDGDTRQLVLNARQSPCGRVSACPGSARRAKKELSARRPSSVSTKRVDATHHDVLRVHDALDLAQELDRARAQLVLDVRLAVAKSASAPSRTRQAIRRERYAPSCRSRLHVRPSQSRPSAAPAQPCYAPTFQPSSALRPCGRGGGRCVRRMMSCCEGGEERRRTGSCRRLRG